MGRALGRWRDISTRRGPTAPLPPSPPRPRSPRRALARQLACSLPRRHAHPAPPSYNDATEATTTLAKPAHNGHDLAENLYLRGWVHERLHLLVSWHQHDVVAFSGISFHRRLASGDAGGHYFTLLSVRLLAYYHVITVEDPCVDHGVPAYS